MFAQNVSEKDMNLKSEKVEYIEVSLDELKSYEDELYRMKFNEKLGNSINISIKKKSKLNRKQRIH